MLVEGAEELEKSSTMTASNVTSASGEASVSSGGGNQNQEAPALAAPAAPPAKRKRNLPGMPGRKEAERVPLGGPFFLHFYFPSLIVEQFVLSAASPFHSFLPQIQTQR